MTCAFWVLGLGYHKTVAHLSPDGEIGRRSGLQFRDVTIVKDKATGDTIPEIAVRGKRGVGYCKSMPRAIRPFECLKSRLRPLRIDEPRWGEINEKTRFR